MALSFVIVEVWILSNPFYTVRIGSENYFSLAIGGIVALFYAFLFTVIKISSNFQFSEQKISLGKATVANIPHKNNI